MREKPVEDYLVAECKKHGAMCLKLVDIGRRGHPDREVVWPWGQIDKVETKRPKGGRFEPGQKPYHQDLADRQVPVYLLNTIEAVDEYVRERVSTFKHLASLRLEALFSVPLP